MIKKSILLMATAAVALWAQAAPLTPQEALNRLSSDKEGKRLAPAASTAALSFTQATDTGEAAVYIFNRGNNQGFMLLSADDAAAPLLGYSDSGSFNPSDIPPQLAYWLEGYAGEIAAVRKAGNTIQMKSESLNFPSDWKPISPLCATRWGQDAPYSNLTPTVNNRHCSTGCVATAMAQVMKYWNYPEKGTGQISYFCESLGTTLSMVFDKQEPFDWGNMLNTYTSGQYTDTEATAVANLMKVCGYSLKMGYTVGNSGTQTSLVGPVLMENFGYSKGIQVVQRISFTATEWNDLAYKALQVGPVIYAAMSPLGGHCFVMDGYDGDGYFHFNWGWSGTSDGFYRLNALNPGQQGTGGAFGGFNNEQCMVIGIQKNDAAPLIDYPQSMSLYASVTCTAASSVLTFSFTGSMSPSLANDGMYTFTNNLGIEITNADGSGKPVYVACSYYPQMNAQFPPGSYLTLSSSDFARARFDSTLPDGKYKVQLVARNGSSGTWQHLYVEPGNYDYVYVTKSGNEYTVENETTKRLKITGAKISTPLYYKNPFQLELTVSNPTDLELTQSVLPYLYYDGIRQYIGETQLITLMPNEETTITIDNNFQQLANGLVPSAAKPIDFDLVLVNFDTGIQYGNFGSVTMNAASGNRSVTLRGISITNASEKETVPGAGLVYGVDDFSDIDINVSFQVTGGFLATPLTAIIRECDPSTYAALAQVYEKQFEQMVYLNPGEIATETSTLRFTDYDPNMMYMITVYYSNNGSRTALGSLRIQASSGVGDITADASGLQLSFYAGTLKAVSGSGIEIVSLYDAGGAKVLETASETSDLSLLPSGLYIAVVKDKAGQIKILKIVK